MDTIFKAKKLQAMHNYKTQFLYNLIFHVLLALACIILCSYPFGFPSLSSSMKEFLFLSLPNKLSSFSSPKCLFIVVNVIVVFLVGESKLVSSHSSPISEIYDEYVQTSRSLRGVSSTVQEKAEERKMEVKLLQERESTTVQEEDPAEEEDKKVIEVSKEVDYKEVKEEIAEEEEEEEGKNEVNRKEEEEEEEEGGLPADELNRRVEEFIARVNKQRLLEARLPVCCKA